MIFSFVSSRFYLIKRNLVDEIHVVFNDCQAIFGIFEYENICNKKQIIIKMINYSKRQTSICI